MNKFLKNLTLFSLVIVFFSVVIDVFISTNLKKSKSFADGEYSVWNDILASEVEADIIINGSSRAFVQIDPEIITDSLKTSCYNFGINGHNFWLQNFRYNLFLKNNQKPKVIIQSLDIFTLGRIENLTNLEQFLPYMFLNYKIYSNTKVYNGFTIWDFIIPAYRYIGFNNATKIAGKMFLNKENKIYRTKGYRGQDKTWNNDFEKAKKTMTGVSMPFNLESVQLFEKHLQYCKKNNIKMIFVYTPEYIEGQKFAKNRKEIFNLYNNFSIKYHIPFYDYSNDNISYQKKYFYNTLHLNKIGATVFTKKFASDLKKNKKLQH